MKPMVHLLALLSLFLLGNAYAQDLEAEIQTRPVAAVNYPWIAFLSEAPAVWVSDVPAKGQYVRLVVYSPAEEDPSIFRVETVTYGDEGCCRKLVRARTFKPEKAMFELFGPFNKKDNAEFEFVRWLSPTSAEFKYYGSTFIFMGLDRNTIRIQRVQR